MSDENPPVDSPGEGMEMSKTTAVIATAELEAIQESADRVMERSAIRRCETGGVLRWEARRDRLKPAGSCGPRAAGARERLAS